MKLVQASLKDKKKLDALTCKSKQFWNYSDTYIKVCLDQITVKETLLKQGRIYKAIDLHYEILGFFGLDGETPMLTLESF
ncbi:MAG: hypothetical protein S4CHLAM7_01840 [Chlamydiae bacterium]|nr:hypothetical protein [Chlamydiota bacterium]